MRKYQHRHNPQSNLETSKRRHLCDAKKKETEPPNQQSQQHVLPAVYAHIFHHCMYNNIDFHGDCFQSFEYSHRLHHDIDKSCPLES
jgi:hypothetical protein